MPLRDSDIRSSLHEWLWEAHSRDKNTVILHELKMPRPSARVDIAVVNGEVCGFEIKSDVDALTRLPRQVKAFSAVFDRVSVVTTDKHIEGARKIIPEWWGILTPANAQSFVQVQQSKENPRRDMLAAIHMLSRGEMCSIMQAHSLLNGFKSKPRPVLIDAITRALTFDQLLFAIRHTLKCRSPNYQSSPPSPALTALD